MEDIVQQLHIHHARCLVAESKTDEAIAVLCCVLEEATCGGIFEHFRVRKFWLIAAFMKAQLEMLAEPAERRQARDTMQQLYDFIKALPTMTRTEFDQEEDTSLLRLLPIPLFKHRLLAAETIREKKDLVKELVRFETRTEPWCLLRRYGGAPYEWLDFLDELRAKRMWIEIESFADIYTQQREKHGANGRPVHDFAGIVMQRNSRHLSDTENDFIQIIESWSDMHCRLAEAQCELGLVATAPEHYGTAFMLRMFLLKEEPESSTLGEVVTDWKTSLRKRLKQMPSEYWSDVRLLRDIEEHFEREWTPAQWDRCKPVLQQVSIDAFEAFLQLQEV
jgi:hypothetical protein